MGPSFHFSPAYGSYSQGLETPGRAMENKPSSTNNTEAGRCLGSQECPGDKESLHLWQVEALLGPPPRTGRRASLGLANRRRLAADRAAAPRRAAAAGPAAAAPAAPAARAAARATTAAPAAAAPAASTARAPAATAGAAAGRAAGAAAAAAGGLAAAHFTAVLVLRAAGEAVPWAAPHGPGGSGGRSGARPEFPTSDGGQWPAAFIAPHLRVLAQRTGCFLCYYLCQFP